MSDNEKFKRELADIMSHDDKGMVTNGVLKKFMNLQIQILLSMHAVVEEMAFNVTNLDLD